MHTDAWQHRIPTCEGGLLGGLVPAAHHLGPVLALRVLGEGQQQCHWRLGSLKRRQLGLLHSNTHFHHVAHQDLSSKPAYSAVTMSLMTWRRVLSAPEEKLLAGMLPPSFAHMKPSSMCACRPTLSDISLPHACPQERVCTGDASPCRHIKIASQAVWQARSGRGPCLHGDYAPSKHVHRNISQRHIQFQCLSCLRRIHCGMPRQTVPCARREVRHHRVLTLQHSSSLTHDHTLGV